MGRCGSSSSNYQPCSRKMSIGITLESFPRPKPENRHRYEEAVVVPENVKPSQGNSMVNADKRKLNVDITTNLEKRLETSGKKNAPLVSPKSVCLKRPPDGNLYPKQTMNLPVLSELHPVCIEEKETSTNQILDSKCNEQKEKMSGIEISEVKRKKDGTVKEQGPDKVAVDRKLENSRGCETLKLKLWEILGAVSSPNKHPINSQQSQDCNVTSKSLHPGLKGNIHGNFGGNVRQNSDTIESDTQKPTETLRRPVTRSLAQKKPPRRQKTIKRRNSPTTSFKDRLDEDIFSFKDGWSAGLSDALNDGLPTPKRKKAMRQSYSAEKGECLVLKANDAQSCKQSQDRGKVLSSTEKSSSRGNVMPFGPQNLDKDFCQTEPRRMEEVTKGIEIPKLQQSAGQPEGFVHSYSNNKVLTDISTRSPSIEMNSPVRRSTSASPTIREVQNFDERGSTERITNTMRTQSLKETDFSTRSPSTEMNTPVRRSSLASPAVLKVQDVDVHSSGQRISDTKGMQSLKGTLGYQHTEVVYPDIATGDKARRKLMKHLEQNQDDGLTSAIALFAFALERLRGKVKSITQKKSAEILKSVADEIYLQLQNAETQIQENMDKVADHGRSKRKRLETKFQDLQGQFTVIYERFKEEVNQQVQVYRDTLEGSGALKVELRGNMEKLRALRRKLLSQAEEAIGNKLSDAQSRIETVHNLGKGKMVQLKNILAEVLRDGVLG